MIQDIISIGDKIDIKPIGHRDKQRNLEKVSVSQLVNYVDHDMIDIAAPMSNGRIRLLDAETVYHICFYTKKGLYQSKCIVINTFRDNNIVTCRVKLTSDLEKYQRRQYYRLEYFKEIEYRFITREEEILSDRIRNGECKSDLEREETLERLRQLDQAWNKATLMNLSGGGVRFCTAGVHEAEDKIIIRLEIEIQGALTILKEKAAIVAVEKLENRKGYYAYRAQFCEIGRKERENVIRFIFEQERKRRKKNHFG
jgi:c-di-GMP-binding flagellar brake protein YcgR